MTAHPADVDMSREPFGIDPRVMGREVDMTTGEVVGPRSETRMFGRDGRADTGWPPLSNGPRPPSEAIPPDLNIGTAQDEIDAWAHEHDLVTGKLAEIRLLLEGDPENPGHRSLKGRLILKRAEARRNARSNPKERGRRTETDITVEVDEALENDPDGIAAQVRALEAHQETLTSRLFKARDNIHRLDAYIRTLPRVGDHRP